LKFGSERDSAPAGKPSFEKAMVAAVKAGYCEDARSTKGLETACQASGQLTSMSLPIDKQVEQHVAMAAQLRIGKTTRPGYYMGFIICLWLFGFILV